MSPRPTRAHPRPPAPPASAPAAPRLPADPREGRSCVFCVAEGAWQVRLEGEVLAATWNSRGAALAALQVEGRRRRARAAGGGA